MVYTGLKYSSIYSYYSSNGLQPLATIVVMASNLVASSY